MTYASRRYRPILICILCIILLSSLRSPQIQYALWSVTSMTASPQDIFVQNTLASDITGPYNGTYLQNLCKQTKWTEGLIFSCGRAHGGVGNVRNALLNCVRFSIAAGAAFVVPVINKRAVKDIAKLEGNGDSEFGMMFDTEHFVTSLMTDCPQLTLYASQDTLWDKPSMASVLELSPVSLAGKVLMRYTLQRPDEWSKSFNHWLKDQTIRHPLLTGPSATEPIHVSLTFPLLSWRTTHDDPEFQTNFGRILRFPLHVRVLSAKVLFALSEKYKLQISSTGLNPSTFLGAHLRTESDAAGWQQYENQFTFYSTLAQKQNLSIIYAASGDPKTISRFRTDAYKLDLIVETKSDLLTGQDLKDLQALRWDQQALVDYGVLERAGAFCGIEESSFAWNLAVKRGLLSRGREALLGREGITFSDEWSWLFGRVGGSGWFVLGIWP